MASRFHIMDRIQEMFPKRLWVVMADQNFEPGWKFQHLSIHGDSIHYHTMRECEPVSISYGKNAVTLSIPDMVYGLAERTFLIDYALLVDEDGMVVVSLDVPTCLITPGMSYGISFSNGPLLAVYHN